MLKTIFTLINAFFFLSTISILFAQHNPGSDCFTCHTQFKLAGTIFTDSTTIDIAPNVSLKLINFDGSETVLDNSNSDGNIAAPNVTDGNYIMHIGNISSRTWHNIPDQGNCNNCHKLGGNSNGVRFKVFDVYHTEIPADNDCKNCHHFPASMNYEQLAAPGVLNINADRPDVNESSVYLFNNEFIIDPKDFEIETTRPDIFAPGYFSMFDMILAVAERNEMVIDYYYDEDRKTHFINNVDGVEGNYWFGFSFDTGGGSGQFKELSYKRANRWDELLWKSGSWVQLRDGENVDELKEVFFDEILREKSSDHMIKNITISINPSDYEGNPSGSGRITFSKEFKSVTIAPHNLRGIGYPSSYSKPFQTGVVTSMDILLSLMDDGKLNVVTGVFYTYFGRNYINGFYIVEMGFPGIGNAHSSGKHGFVYVTENGSLTTGLPNNANKQLHITSDIHVIHAPEFSRWRWLELGNPYYEKDNPTSVTDPLINEDYEAIDRGFNLHPPYPNPFNGSVRISFNIFEPNRAVIIAYDILGRKVAQIFDDEILNIGVQELNWNPKDIPSGTYFIVMTYGTHQQTRNISYIK